MSTRARTVHGGGAAAMNGGNDGAVVPAYGGLGGSQPDNALARGQTLDATQLTCNTNNRGQCLSQQQVFALKRSFGGPADKNGRRLYSRWLFDAGLGSNDWRAWKTW